MGGVFSFIGGLVSLGISVGMGIKEDIDQNSKNEEYLSHNYNLAIQMEYDDLMRLNRTFDLDAIRKKVQEEYPRMNSLWVEKIVLTATAKHLMERETAYEYYLPDDVMRANLGDITRFIKEV